MHKCWNEILFQDSEETIDSAEKNDNSYESLADFQWEAKKKEKHKNQVAKTKIAIFQLQQLSGCPTKGHFTAKSGRTA